MSEDETSGITEKRGQLLVQIARQAVFEVVAGETFEPLEAEPWLRRHGATFVTLRRGGELRGCVGSLEARLPLLEDLRENACSAALRDPRFVPLSVAELDDLEVEVSLLSALSPIEGSSEREVLENLRPGVDGVVLQYLDQRGTYLPQVWEALPDPVEFLARLKQKVGLEADFWDPEMRFWRYTVSKWCRAEAG